MIDESRLYSNHGPLASRLEQRLGACLGLPAGAMACASSGTAAIIGAILATAGPAKATRRLAAIPAFTFVATAAAVERCGYEPYLVDIDRDSWMLDPARLARHPLIGRFGAVVPVAPFGRPVPQQPWLAFQRATDIAVVIDGAASFDTVLAEPALYLGEIPVAFSFHATKCFGTGEGGAAAMTDPALASRITRSLNFGFRWTRDSQAASTNGKMSEYHAAVGLAGLDEWDDKKSAFLKVAATYRQAMEDAQIARSLLAAPDISMSYALFLCRDGEETERVTASLDRNGIDCRLWYGEGVHRQSYFAAAAHDPLDVTEALAPRVIGLPVSHDLTEADIQRVVTAIRDGL